MRASPGKQNYFELVTEILQTRQILCERRKNLCLFLPNQVLQIHLRKFLLYVMPQFLSSVKQ